MSRFARAPVILCAEDDPDDQTLTRDALAEGGNPAELRFVGDGEELLDYLHRRGAHSDPSSAPTPGLILLDLNMPRLDGREALQAIRADRTLHNLPVVVFTTSNAEEDVQRLYDLGANSYVVKPVSFQGLVRVLDDVRRYWFETVELPPAAGS